jgi:hypothetical protein
VTTSIERYDFIIHTQNEFFIHRTKRSLLGSNSGFLFLATLLLTVPQGLEANIINATSPALSEVQSVINSAVDGDTVVIPAGTATWTSKMTITKAITLQGAGVGSTIIKDGVQSKQLLVFTLVAGKASRMTGIEFQNGGRTSGGVTPGGVFRVVGHNTDGSLFRADHCKFNGVNGSFVLDTVIGVIDHNTILSSYGGFFGIYATNWDGATSNWGDSSWAAPSAIGSSQFTFFEDNDYTCTASGVRAMTDAYAGARFVVRHNTLHNANIQNHGTDSTGRTRGGRIMDVYNNRYVGTNRGNIVGDCRSGIVLFHDNTISGYRANPVFLLRTHRMFYGFRPFLGADGTNQWDVNQPGGPFFTGIASGAGSGTTVTVTGRPGWTENQWRGYSVKRITNLGHARGPAFSEIRSNTANTLTFSSAGGYGRPPVDLSFANGDALQIWKVTEALDQPGRAGGSLIRGNRPPLPPGWNNQVTEPCYSWNNTREGGAHVNFSAGQKVMRGGEHFFNDTPMPGYAPYPYPHPLVTGEPTPTPTAGATPQEKRKEKKKKQKTKKAQKLARWGAERLAPNQLSLPSD